MDDLAAAYVHAMNLPRAAYQAETEPLLSYLNVGKGTGTDCTIRELAESIARLVENNGRLVSGTTKPDGTPRKLLDVLRMRRPCWEATIPLEAGLGGVVPVFLEDARPSDHRI